MVDCPNCRTFSGAPTCSCCKTYFRVGKLLRGGRLSGFQETAVLAILRNAAGALSDLVETGESGPFGRSSPDGSEEAELGASPLKEGAKKEAKKESKKEPKEAEQEVPKTEKTEDNTDKKAKVPKKEKKNRRRGEKSEKKKKKTKSQLGQRESPERGEDRKEEESKRGEALESRGSRTPHGEDRGSRSRSREQDRDRAPEGGEKRQEKPDREVGDNPDKFGLEPIPIRGSAGRHHGPIPARSQRPSEPGGEPPERRDYEDRHCYEDRHYYDYGDYIGVGTLTQGPRDGRDMLTSSAGWTSGSGGKTSAGSNGPKGHRESRGPPCGQTQPNQRQLPDEVPKHKSERKPTREDE